MYESYRRMTQSHQNINEIIIFFAYCPRISVFGHKQIPMIWLVKGYPITLVIGSKNNSHIRLLFQKKKIHFKRGSRHRRFCRGTRRIKNKVMKRRMTVFNWADLAELGGYYCRRGVTRVSFVSRWLDSYL